MLQSWIDNNRRVQIVQRSNTLVAFTEVEVGEDATGLLTIYVRQLGTGLGPVAVKFVGPEAKDAAESVALPGDASAATREALGQRP